MGGPITAFQTLYCDWSPHKFIEKNFSKLTDSSQIFRINFVYIHYHLCKISPQIIDCKIFDPYDFLEINSTTNYSVLVPLAFRIVNLQYRQHIFTVLSIGSQTCSAFRPIST